MAILVDLLARALGLSRTQATRLLDEGRVRAPAGDLLVDRKRRYAEDALPATVLVDDAPVELHEQVHLVLHKPVGVITALRDDHHAVAADLLREAPLFTELRPVGRLDLDTSGLLLWTTEGAFVQRLTHPKRQVPRTYEAALARPFEPPPPDFALDDGHRPDVRSLEVIRAEDVHPALVRAPAAWGYARLTIVGGAYHEVRRIFAALGSHVEQLCRTRYGALELPRDLPAGGYRLLRKADVLGAAAG